MTKCQTTPLGSAQAVSFTPAPGVVPGGALLAASPLPAHILPDINVRYAAVIGLKTIPALPPVRDCLLPRALCHTILQRLAPMFRGFVEPARLWEEPAESADPYSLVPA